MITSAAIRTTLRRRTLEATILLLACAIAVSRPVFLTSENVFNVLRQLSFNLILSTGMTMVIITRGLDLSAGSIVALSGCITAIVIKSHGIGAGILSGLVVGALCGVLNGLLVTRIKLPPFIVTLGTMSVLKGLALMSTGGAFVSDLPKSFGVLGGGYLWIVPIPVIIAVSIAAVGHVVLSNTRFGLSTQAIGGNYEAARMAGVSNERVLTTVYAVCGLLASVVGILLVSRVSSAQPYFGEGFSLNAVAAVLIGGTSVRGGGGGIGRTALGVLLMGLAANGLNLLNVHYFWQQVLAGGVLLGAALSDRFKVVGGGGTMGRDELFR